MNIITWPYILRAGHSNDPSQGACAMDAVNWLAHGKHGDQPECACPVIAAYVVRGNDAMPHDVRQRLLPYLHRIAGSRSEEHEAARLRIAVLDAVRVFAPSALDAAGLQDEAEKLRSLPDDVTYADAADAARYAAAADAARWTAAPADAADAARWAAAVADARRTAAPRRAAAAADDAAAATRWAAAAAADADASWDLYFDTLDRMLTAGPQGEPWSADVVDAGASLYRASKGLAIPVA